MTHQNTVPYVAALLENNLIAKAVYNRADNQISLTLKDGYVVKVNEAHITELGFQIVFEGSNILDSGKVIIDIMPMAKINPIRSWIINLLSTELIDTFFVNIKCKHVHVGLDNTISYKKEWSFQEALHNASLFIISGDIKSDYPSLIVDYADKGNKTSLAARENNHG